MVTSDIEQLYTLFQQFPRICTDTRKMQPDCLFFALSGPNFDGNAFAGQALDNGAAMAIVSDSGLSGQRFFHVDDTLVALQDLAKRHRASLDIPVIGITGSNGKTTTKELMHAVLTARYRTFATQGNLNNHIGVPLTLLAIPKDTELAIVEMGANHVGEIAGLCEMTRPTHGVVTNIGKAHLEGFGSVNGIKKGKGELFDALAATHGIAFVNPDLDHLEEISAQVEDRRLYHIGKALSTAPGALTMQRQSIEDREVLRVLCGDEDVVVDSQLFGEYNLLNIATAVAIGVHFNVPLGEIKQAVESYVPQNHRSQRISLEHLDLVMDAYNANPSSMRLAIESFAREKGEKALVLGEMLELGEGSGQEHLATLDHLDQFAWSEVFLVGAEFRLPAQGRDVIWFENVDQLNDYLREHPMRAQKVLIKGSRSVRLERLIEIL